MPLQKIFSLLAGATSIIGFSIYIWFTVTGKIKPKILTWVIWAVLDTVLFLGMLAKHSLNYQMWTVIFFVWVVVLVSLRKGTRGWSKTDAFCLFGSITSIIAWIATKNPTVGIVLILLVNLLGTVPNIVSAWEDPSRENWKAWIFGFISPLCALLSVPKLTLDFAGQPIVFAVITGTMIILSLRRKRYRMEVIQ